MKACLKYFTNFAHEIISVEGQQQCLKIATTVCFTLTTNRLSNRQVEWCRKMDNHQHPP